MEFTYLFTILFATNYRRSFKKVEFTALNEEVSWSSVLQGKTERELLLNSRQAFFDSIQKALKAEMVG